jgi:hypothetical protein
MSATYRCTEGRIMTESRSWRRLVEDGVEWEVRVVPGSEREDEAHGEGEVLEFLSTDGTRKSRRLAVSRGAVAELDEEGLRRAYRQARPIGGDHYGRPGKQVDDAP